MILINAAELPGHYKYPAALQGVLCLAHVATAAQHWGMRTLKCFQGHLNAVRKRNSSSAHREQTPRHTRRPYVCIYVLGITSYAGINMIQIIFLYYFIFLFSRKAGSSRLAKARRRWKKKEKARKEAAATNTKHPHTQNMKLTHPRQGTPRLALAIPRSHNIRLYIIVV